MRKLTIKREKSFVGCLAKMKVYIEDGEGGDEKLPVYEKDESGEIKKEYINCRKIGELKNGEESVFEIGDEAAKIFVIADKLSKDYCNECYQLSEGSEDISLTGRNKLNPAAGNAFRFDGNDTQESYANRRFSIGKGVLVLIAALLIGLILGYGITTAIFDGIGREEKTFTVGEMSITLNESFDRYGIPGYSAVLYSNKVELFVNRYGFDDIGTSKYDASDYARLVILANGFDAEITDNGNVAEFTFEGKATDGESYRYFAYVHKSDNAYWLLQFAVEEGKADKLADDIAKWAASVSFE